MQRTAPNFHYYSQSPLKNSNMLEAINLEDYEALSELIKQIQSRLKVYMKGPTLPFKLQYQSCYVCLISTVGCL